MLFLSIHNSKIMYRACHMKHKRYIDVIILLIQTINNDSCMIIKDIWNEYRNL